MWRQSDLWENPDSDLSISDEEELDGDIPGDCVSLGGRDSEEKEEGLRLQSRLEMLRGVVHSYGSKEEFSSKLTSEQTNSYLDDVEIPDSPCEGDGSLSRTTFQCIRNEEFVSGYENGAASDTFSKEENQQIAEVPDGSEAASGREGHGNGEKDETNTWALINQEAEALLNLNNVSCLPFPAHCKADRSCAKSKGRSRFSFHFQSHKEVSWPSISEEEIDLMPKPLELPETSRNADADASSITRLSEGSLQERENQLVMIPAEPEALDHDFSRQSMSEILDNLQANRSHLRKNFQRQSAVRGKSEQLAFKKSLHILGDQDLDFEYSPENMDDGLPSDEEELALKNSLHTLGDQDLGFEESPENMDDGLPSDEEAHRYIELAIPEKKGSMAERFQEALGPSYEDALVVAPKSLSIGLFGKLQHLMQSEKEMDALFLKMSKVKSDESAFDVKIVSGYLDAKLKVCHCSLVETMQWHDSPKRMESDGDRRTVIFSPRICSNVDLEIGNTIRIYHPWKEVRAAGCTEKVVLSAYFSQIPL